MIARIQDVRKVRGVAQNVADCDIERFIEDAEYQDILPRIGAEKYFEIEEEPEKFEDVLNGGTFRDERGSLGYSRGLLTAISYLTYSRLLLFGDLQVTASGTVKKALQYSTSPSDAERSMAADGARKMGLSILENVAEMLQKGEKKCPKRHRSAGCGVIKKIML